MTVEEFYQNINENYQDVVKRLASKAIVDRIVIKFKDDQTFNDLQKALEQKNYEEAFRFAHTLKGISANLGFTQLFESSNILTESLRNNIHDQLEEQYQKVKEDYQQIINHIKEVK